MMTNSEHKMKTAIVEKITNNSITDLLTPYHATVNKSDVIDILRRYIGGITSIPWWTKFVTLLFSILESRGNVYRFRYYFLFLKWKSYGWFWLGGYLLLSYGHDTVPHMMSFLMTGKAYARALRGHLMELHKLWLVPTVICLLLVTSVCGNIWYTGRVLRYSQFWLITLMSVKALHWTVSVLLSWVFLSFILSLGMPLTCKYIDTSCFGCKANNWLHFWCGSCSVVDV